MLSLNTFADLPYVPGTNSRGICYVKAAQCSNVDDFPDFRTLMKSHTDFSVYDEALITLTSGTFKTIAEGGTVRIELLEKMEQTAHGPLFTYTVAFVIHNDTAAKGALLPAFDQHPQVLKVMQRTGAYRLIGAKENGARFVGELATGTVQKDANEYACGYTWQCYHRALYLEEA